MNFEGPRLQAALADINALDVGRFPLLLTRIVQKLHLKEQAAFSAAEQVRLASMLGLGPVQLEHVLAACEYVLQDALYHAATPASLTSALAAAGLHHNKAEAFGKVWDTHAAGLREKVVAQSVHPQQLQRLHWRLHLPMATRHAAQLKHPLAILQLQCADNQPLVTLECSRSDLVSLLEKLNTVQEQLDALAAK